MDAREQKRYRIAIAVVTGIGVLGLAWDLLRRTGGERETPASNPSPPVKTFVPAAEGTYPTCDDLEAAYKQRASRLGCEWHVWLRGRAICELPYREHKECVPSYERAVQCIKALPDSSWQCDPTHSVTFKDGECANEVAAVRKCLGG